MKTMYAVYENGVFRPEGPVSLHAGARVEINLPEQESATVEELRKRFPKSCGVLAAGEADAIMRVIDEECERIEPHEWAAGSLR